MRDDSGKEPALPISYGKEVEYYKTTNHEIYLGAFIDFAREREGEDCVNNIIERVQAIETTTT